MMIYMLSYASVPSFGNYLLPLTMFLSAVIGFLNSTVVMRLCQPNGKITYIYNMMIQE